MEKAKGAKRMDGARIAAMRRSRQGDARHNRKLTKLKKFRVPRIATCIAANTTIRRN
jgi:hypothetical protein